MTPKPLIVSLLGPTNSGKTTIIDHFTTVNPDKFTGVLIGREMRKRYPPEHFQGKAQMADTEAEVLEILWNGVKAATTPVILVDGQPRNLNQITWMEAHFCRDYRWCAVNCYAPRPYRVERAEARDPDPEKLALSMKRMDDDVLTLYEVVETLRSNNLLAMYHSNTTEPRYLYGIEAFIDRIAQRVG